jgi:hypothetical protein
VPFEELQARGWHLQPNHFYWPLNDVPFLRENPDLWARRSPLANIDWDLDGQERLAMQLGAFASELADVRRDLPGEPGEFVWNNGNFSHGDAYAYYGLVRHLRPRRVIEVGIGWSGLLLGRAETAGGEPIEVRLVDPHPDEAALRGLPGHWQVERSPVQRVDPAVWETLSRGDILFYDGSHCVRTAGDVNWILFEVLPRLQEGVWVHFHDIAWPFDYPTAWVIDEGLSWNEQYFLQAFLMHNSAYRVRLAVQLVTSERRAVLEKAFPGSLGGGSVWLEKLPPAAGASGA